MAECNGFKLRGQNQASGRISVKSTIHSTWMITYKKPWSLMPVEREVIMQKDELIILKCEDGADFPVVEIKPLGDKAGVMIVQSSRRGHRTLRVGKWERWELEPGEALVCRTSAIAHPRGNGAGLIV